MKSSLIKELLRVATLVGAFTIANHAQANSNKIVSLTGTLSFEQHSTITCLAIGCPPSMPYYQTVLKTKINGVNQNVLIAGMTSEAGKSEKPACIKYSEICYPEGSTVRLNTSLKALSNKVIKTSDFQDLEIISIPYHRIQTANSTVLDFNLKEPTSSLNLEITLGCIDSLLGYVVTYSDKGTATVQVLVAAMKDSKLVFCQAFSHIELNIKIKNTFDQPIKKLVLKNALEDQVIYLEE